MDDSVTVLNLLTKGHDLVLVHGPDLIESVFVTLLESLVFSLKEQEFFCESLIVLSVLSIELSIGTKVIFEFALDSSENIKELSLSLLKTVLGVFVYLLSLLENFKVKVKFGLIELVDSLHVLHTFLKNLHLFL